MLIKTINLPAAMVAIAEQVHRLLLDPPAVDWILDFRGPHSQPGPASRCEQLVPSLSIAVPGPAAEYLSKVDVLAFATQLGQRILDRKQSIELGGVTVRVPELARVRLDQSSIANGYLTLPPISVELPGFPDPTIVGIKAERGRRSFLVHLRGRMTNAPLEIRVAF